MALGSTQIDAMPVVRDPLQFDQSSGSWLERLVFNHRVIFILFCTVVTGLLGMQLTGLRINANFDKVIPHNHPYIKNYLENRDKLGGVGNAVRVVVENRKGDIFDPDFLEATRKINQALFLTPGTDRAWMRSIWMSSVRWTEVTEEGFRGGSVMPENYDGSPAAVEALKRNLRAAGVVGSLVGTDYKSLLFVVPLLEKNPETGQQFDYGTFSRLLESEVRHKYEFARSIEKTAGQYEDSAIKVHIVGYAKLVGDLIDGVRQMMTYFCIAAAVAAAIIFLYTRCVRSTVLVLVCSIVAVVWQVGLLCAFGFDLDPYSILVPFLVFAIGVSHGAQKMNGIMQDVGRGTHKLVAARYTFRRLFVAGLTALLADAVGFAVLMVIDIPVIKDLALTASIGVAVLIFTNLLLLPVALSYVGVSARAARRSLAADASGGAWGMLGKFTERRWAITTVVIAALLTAGGVAVALNLKVGDLDPGAPELRPNARYNLDVGYINDHYQLSGDQFVVIVKTPNGGCEKFATLKETERLSTVLQGVPGVRQTFALSDNVKKTIAGLNEGNPKWMTISRNPALLGGAVYWITTDSPEVVDKSCSVIPVVAYLSDHKSETLDRVVAAVEQFAKEHDDTDLKFLMAAGSSGIEAVTNIVVRHSIVTMYAAVYGAVALLCLITFRSWRATVVALVPLVITSILCKSLMVWLGIGLKVATLPVIALGVGIGVDYALYLLSVQLAQQRAGRSLGDAYRTAVAFTGKVVALVGITLAAGVVTWAWSPIKFQADMGVLLTFMLLWNMVGALILIPALSHFLLRTVGSSPSAKDITGFKVIPPISSESGVPGLRAIARP
jgi:predicted RND superfamily exporter protein